MPELEAEEWPERAHNAAEVLRARQLELLATREYSYGQTRRSRQRKPTVGERLRTALRLKTR
jgi:hypothetical protein